MLPVLSKRNSTYFNHESAEIVNVRISIIGAAPRAAIPTSVAYLYVELD